MASADIPLATFTSPPFGSLINQPAHPSETATRTTRPTGAEYLRTLDACPVERTHRVRVPPLGAARRVGDWRHRPPFLRAPCPEYPARSDCVRVMSGWPAAVSIRPSMSASCPSPPGVHYAR